MSLLIKKTTEKLQGYLTELMGTIEIAHSGAFVIRKGSTIVTLRVIEGVGDTSTIVVCGWILTNVPRSDELNEYIAYSDVSLYGRLALDETEDPNLCNIRLYHTLLGDYLDKGEVEAAVFSAAYVCDHLDDDLQTRFGGSKFED